MSLLNLFAAARTEVTTSARKTKLARRPMIDCLEKREVFTAGIAQAGTTMGLAWRFAPDGSSTGGGTLYVQDVAKGTNTSDKTNSPIAINQHDGHIVFDVDYSQPFYGASVSNTAQVKVVLGATAGDLNVYDDRGGSNMLRTVNRHQTGSMSMGQNSLSWTLDENVVTQQAVVNIQSSSKDKSVYNINPTYLNLSPGDPGYVANSNPITGLEVTDSGEDSGGVTVEQGMHITVNTTGGATFKNHMPK